MSYFKTTGPSVPHTLLGIEGELTAVPAGNGLWETQAFTAQREFKNRGGVFYIKVSYDKGHISNLCNGFTMIRSFDGVSGPLEKEECEEFWPELLHLVSWHLSSEGEPLHYLSNTLFWAAKGHTGLGAARRCAKWPDAPESLLLGAPNVLKAALIERLPALQKQFRDDLAATGLAFTSQE